MKLSNSLITLWLSTILLFTHTQAQSNWHVAITGNDTLGDGSFGNPYATIHHTANETEPGDTVFVHAGVYRNADFEDGDIWEGTYVARITAIGTPDNFIVFTPYEDDEVLIEFDGIYGFLIQNASYLKIRGFEFKGIADQITQTEADSAWGLYMDSLGVIHDLAVEMGIDISDPALIGQTINKPETPNITKPSYYNGRAIVANKSHHIEFMDNVIRCVPSAAIRGQQSDYLSFIGNEVYNNTYWTTQGVGAITISESQVRPAGDTNTGIKIILNNNSVYGNENRMISWNPTKTFVHFAIDEGTGLFLTRNNDTYDHGYILIANNIAYHNGASGIVVHHTNRAIVEHNTVYYNGTTNHGLPGGIGVNTVDDVVLRNNISYARPEKWALGILAAPVTNTIVDSNLIFNEYGPESVHRNMPEGWNEASPLFSDQDSADFTLTFESPAIDMGSAAATQGEDIEGNPRDSLPDIGAYEYVEPSGTAPYVVNPIRDIVLFEDFGSIVLAELDTVFSDTDGELLEYTVDATDSICSYQLDGRILQLVSIDNQYGSMNLIAIAIDPTALTASDTILVTILPVNDLPTAFSLIQPPDDTTFSSNNDTIVVFGWSEAFSNDGENVHYELKFEWSQSDSIWGPFDANFAEIDITGFERNTPISWSVLAFDDTLGFTASVDTYSIEIDATVGIDPVNLLPTEYLLEQNYPNPFNPVTTIHYDLPQRSDVQIAIYDLLGREVKTLLSENQSAGYKSVQWDASNVASGMYIYQIKAGEFVQTRKMILLK